MDSITNENNKEHNEKWPLIPDHPYRILIIGGSGSRKRNALINSIKEQDDIAKIYLYAKDLSEDKILQWSKCYSFLTIDTTLPASGLLRFRKNLLPSYKNDSNWSN